VYSLSFEVCTREKGEETSAKREARMTARVAPNRDGAGISTRISTQRLMGRVPATTYNYAGDESTSIEDGRRYDRKLT
jgi:hypothetical protein